MEQMTDLKELLKHDIQMLCSTEDQIIEALPAMIEKASNPQLKQGLNQHLEVTKQQRQRLNVIKEELGVTEQDVTRYSGIMSTLMGGTKCKGMEGIIDEGQKMLAMNASSEILDAAIIAGSQKIEHFEIACYGTARTYAQQLGLSSVEKLLSQTLEEERMADQQLTNLAERSVNQRANATMN